MSVEHDVIIPDYQMLEVEYINTNEEVLIHSSIFNEEIEYVPLNEGIVINFSIGETPQRVQKTYSNHSILPIYYSLGDPNSTEVGFSREVREHDMILPFGDNSQTPRKQPTELIYRAKKMKNKFAID